ncbi:glycoside hydrolase superfamily [Dioszegia hungarica]|uniref:Glycoside hydrolase superfamily n=1 Tax=Dioszegia hungarica TaxID=4972 RepID=A0AA38H1F3_9TREE|nr:glycoside hydrolase superfamily [Dioszegia hungarica]KAI9631942.1 glycoside hydrolase superfamily [Dioszegia hungarica]
MSATSPPQLRKLSGNVHQLFVKDKPFLIRSAEIGNSSMSSARWMSTVWPKMVENNVNTLLGSVTWEMVEPREGEFDFAELDLVLAGAREHGLRLILLWFGAHKNGQGLYAPEWVKKNPSRFPRAEITQDGVTRTTHTFSVFSPSTYEADATAFARLISHLKDVDAEHQTVIMVQVQNEVGILKDTRDRCQLAQHTFDQPVPSSLLTVLREQWAGMNATFRNNFPHLSSETLRDGGGWAATFGSSDQTDELFMAYHYALSIEAVASKGKLEYDLPMFANAWLRNMDEEEGQDAAFSGGVRPGDYPSGGPVETVLDIWQLFAPSLAFLAPDIYLTDYTKTCQLYTHRDNALFIPEQRRDEYGAIRIWEAIGRFNAIATSPFGLDSHTPLLSPFTAHYALLRSVSPLILDARARGLPTYGLFFDRFEKGEKDPSPIRTLQIGSWNLKISRSYSPGHPSPGYGMIIQVKPDSFLGIGEGFQIVFTPTTEVKISGILAIEEKEVVDEETGELSTLRRFNGDEVRSGFTMPATKPDMGDFVIESFIPAHTRIALCTLYTV